MRGIAVHHLQEYLAGQRPLADAHELVGQGKSRGGALILGHGRQHRSQFRQHAIGIGELAGRHLGYRLQVSTRANRLFDIFRQAGGRRQLPPRDASGHEHDAAHQFRLFRGSCNPAIQQMKEPQRGQGNGAVREQPEARGRKVANGCLETMADLRQI